MLSKQIARRSAAAVLILSFVICIQGDSVSTQDFVYYGKIVQITSEEVFLDQACSQEYRKPLRWENIRVLLFHGDCLPPVKKPQVAGIGSGKCAKSERKIVYVVIFKDGNRAYATSLSTDGSGGVTINLYSDKGSIRGPLEQVSQVSRSRLCPDAIQESRWPKEYTQ